MTSVARLPKLVVMNNEVEIDTRHEVISSIEGSSLPWKFFCEEKGGNYNFCFTSCFESKLCQDERGQPVKDGNQKG